MTKNKTFLLAIAVAATVAIGAFFDPSNVDPDHKFSWSENTGWWNWRDADGTDQGVFVGNDFLTGYVWGENAGWINVGDGTGPYANTTGMDCGVNILFGGDLDGFAWSENRGWINFGWAASTADPNRARYDSAAGRFQGYAWGENAGWINLDAPTHYVATEPGDIGTPLPAVYPDNRQRNRYIAFDPNKAENDGVNVAFRITLTSLLLGSCDDSGDPDVEGWPCRTDDDCRACAVDENPCWTAPLHCRETEPPEVPNTCELTGAVCLNDYTVDIDPVVGKQSVGRSWWVGPKHGTYQVHLMVTEPYRLVSTDWPDPVSVADCEIVPVATYEVVAVNVDTSAESDPLAVSTVAKPDRYWADCVGPLGHYCTGNWAPCGDAVCPPPPPDPNLCDLGAQLCDDGVTVCGDAVCPPGESCVEQWPPPDGIINFNDVTAAVFKFSGQPGLTVTKVEDLDLHGTMGAAPDPYFDPPNYAVNFADIADMVSAFKGYAYKYSDPGDCPDVCDEAVYPDCAP